MGQWFLPMDNLLLSFLFGTVGFSYFIYGKKQRRTVPLVVGACLCALPYVVTNFYADLAVGTVLCFVPLFVKSAA